MRVRRARSLVLEWTGDTLRVINFLSQQSTNITVDGLQILSKATTWLTEEDLSKTLQQFDAGSSLIGIRELVAGGLLLLENEPLAIDDEKYADTWEWGIFAALHCFTIKDVEYLTTEQCIDFLEQKKQGTPSPSLVDDDACFRVELPQPDLESAFLKLAYRRRSIRKWESKPVTLQQLSNILFSAFGVTAFVEHPQLGRLPLTTTPSGGARNPFDCYVAVKNVEGLLPGLYKYSGKARKLQFISCLTLPVSVMLGDQEWADDAALVVFCVANWKRTMWKYPHPGGYRVVLIEAGHIAQNILLAATEEGLGGVPTCALGDNHVETSLGLDRIDQAVVHAVALGHPIGALTPWTSIAIQ